MNKAILIRFETTDEGTSGVFLSKKFKCFTLELPYRNNQKNISCIPKGIYNCKYKYSRKFKDVFHLQDVEDRTYIYIHSGNFAGDVNKSLQSQTEGCILLGERFGELSKQLAVLNSRRTIDRLFEHFGKEDFELIIEEKFI